jgi:16S rRNA (guanine527-N7)-methyltransferase
VAADDGLLTASAFQGRFDVSRETMARLSRYVALLEKWNRRINLVSPRSLEDVWRRHILDSAQLLHHLPPAPPGRPLRLMDIGSGAGLPGLVLAAMIDAEVHLVESDGRKAVFLREAARQMGLSPRVHAVRIESLAGVTPDVVTARALAPLPKLLRLAAPFLCATADRKVPSCGLFLKGREVAKEIILAHKEWEMSVESIPSLSDPQGVVLRIQGLRPLDRRP